MGKDFLSHHRGKDGLEKDIDFHNQRLWKRKNYKNQQQKDQNKKQFREFKKIQAQQADSASQNVDEKQRRFYENLFTKQESEKSKDETTEKDTPKNNRKNPTPK